MLFKCKVDCFAQGRLWTAGESYEGSEPINCHFEEAGKFEPKEEKGVDMSAPMTLSEGQAAATGETSLQDSDKEDGTLGAVSKLFE